MIQDSQRSVEDSCFLGRYALLLVLQFPMFCRLYDPLGHLRNIALATQHNMPDNLILSYVNICQTAEYILHDIKRRSELQNMSEMTHKRETLGVHNTLQTTWRGYHGRHKL
jgi:hypothetical protein